MNLPRPLFETQTDLGEGLVWDAITNQLYWVDINTGCYFKAIFPNGPVESFEIGQRLGVLALRAKGGIVMAAENGFGFFEESTQTFTLLDNFSAVNHSTIRFNDGAVGPKGRFFAGTIDIN
ncbi:MAG: SMP-30/gluconolactonase/LRE family protein [Saprospiraceae bacterium]